MDTPTARKSSPLTGFHVRLFNVAGPILMLIDYGFSYNLHGHPSRLFIMLGWVVLGIGLFLRPIVLAGNLRENKPRMEELALITQSQWNVCRLVAAGIVVVALLAKFASAAA